MENTSKKYLDTLDTLIDQYLEDPHFSIDYLCQEIGLSRSQLNRTLKEEANTSISIYIRQRRLQKAQELLRLTDLRIVEISEKIGVDSPQTFTKYFTQEFGISPSEYRKTLTSQEAEATTDVSVPNLPPIPSPTEVPRRSKMKLYGVLGILSLVIIAGIFYFWKTLDATSAEPSIAILPFKVSQQDTSQVLLAEGLMGQMHASLASLENLKVISKISSSLFRNSTKSIPQIATELAVNYIVVGSVQKQGQRFRINIELIKASEDRSLWAKTFESNLQESLSSMNEVAKKITLELHQQLSETQTQNLNRIPTQNEEAYREFLQGKQLMLSRVKEKLEASIQRFDKAIELDPNFADAYAHKASAYFILSSDDFIDFKKGLKLSEQNALTAIRLDGQNALAYATLANGYRQQNKWEQAVTTYQIALKYSPNDAQILYWYSITLRSLGKMEEAIEYSTKALSLDPLYPVIIVGHAGNFSHAGKMKEAKQVLDNYQLTLDGFYPYYFVKAYYYINLSDYRSALKEFIKCDSISPNVKSVKYNLLYCQAKLGNTDIVKKHLKTVAPVAKNYVELAVIYAGLGDKDNCLKYLEKGVEEGMVPIYLKVSPLFKFLHSDARFQALLEKLGLNLPI